MRIDSEQLPQHLARGLKNLYLVFGEELLLALEAADRIRANARSDRTRARVGPPIVPSLLMALALAYSVN